MATETDKLKCAVVGGSGYVGGELVRMLAGHPFVRLVAVTANEAAGRPIEDVHPGLRGLGITLGALHEVANADMLFLALPNTETMKATAGLPDLPFVDTSADFRLRNLHDFERFYGVTHCDPARIASFSYGLPELFRSRLREARNIAAPGCFATATTLALFPLVDAGLADSIVVNAVTGSSGSGIKPKAKAHHPFRNGSFFAYEVFTHRHQPEIRQALKDATGRDIDFVFQPHSGPFVRGIFVTAAIRLTADVTQSDLTALYSSAYSGEQFVRLVGGSPNVKWVQGTNYCDISVHANGRTAIVMAAIDNLMKGAASQAVQAFNVRNGFPENAGLPVFGATL